MPRKLPWPMTRIDRDVLHELWCEAKPTGKPITCVVQAAVNDNLNAKLSPPIITASAPSASFGRWLPMRQSTAKRRAAGCFKHGALTRIQARLPELDLRLGSDLRAPHQVQ